MIARAAGVAGLLAGFATLAIVLLISYDVGMRYFFNEPQVFVDELASFSSCSSSSAAPPTPSAPAATCASTSSPGTSPVSRARLRTVTLALGIAFLGVVIWVTTHSAITAFNYGRVSAVMLYPLWLPMLLIPAGLALMALVMAAALARQVKILLGPRSLRDEVAPDDHA